MIGFPRCSAPLQIRVCTSKSESHSTNGPSHLTTMLVHITKIYFYNNFAPLLR